MLFLLVEHDPCYYYTEHWMQASAKARFTLKMRKPWKKPFKGHGSSLRSRLFNLTAFGVDFGVQYEVRRGHKVDYLVF